VKAPSKIANSFMTTNIGRHYTYKVTFPGMPWYYFGVHTENGKPYYGSPKTHKWVWKFYDHEIQILEWFEDRREAELVEDRIIAHFIKDPNCLNEHYGGYFTEEARQKSLQKIHSVKTPEGKSAHAVRMGQRGGAKCHECKLPDGRSKAGVELQKIIHKQKTEEGKSKNAVKAGQASVKSRKESGIFLELCSRGGQEGCKVIHSEKTEDGRSLHAIRTGAILHKQKTEDGKSKNAVLGGSIAGKISTAQRYMDPDHPELGEHSAPVIARKQKARGYPSGPETRVRVK
jgi:hypothetical protein